MALPNEANIAAVVVTYHTGPVLFECLDRLAADPLIREIIVVDNGNPGEVSAQLAARPDVALIAGQGNVGFARGSNLGAAEARASYLAFINPDALIDPGCFTALLEAAAGASTPWIVGARLVGRDGREQRGSRRNQITLWSAAISGLGLTRLASWHPAFTDPHLERAPLPAGPTRVGAVSGAAMVMRAEDFARLGGFDEDYFLHGDDIDLCRRAIEEGGDVIFQPGARVLHVGASSKASSSFVARNKAIGLIHYFLKFARTPLDRIAAILAAPFIFLLIVGAGIARDALRLIRR